MEPASDRHAAGGGAGVAAVVARAKPWPRRCSYDLPAPGGRDPPMFTYPSTFLDDLYETEPGADERRVQPRVQLNVEVTLASEHNFYTGLSQDISTGGIFVATRDVLVVGDRLSLTFKPPGMELPFETQAEVRWVRPPWTQTDAARPAGMGLRFLNLSPYAREVIAGFLRTRDSLYFDSEEG